MIENATTKKTANNGLRVLCEPIPSVRSVAVGVWCRAGVLEETPSNNGITHLVEHMLFKGTGRRTAAQISTEIDSVGGVLDAFTEAEGVAFSARVMYEHLDLSLDLLSDIILHSTIPEEELAKEKNVVGEELRMYEDSPDDKVHDLIIRALQPSSPTGLPILGSFSTVNAITRDEILDFRAAHFLGANMVVAAAGYLDAEDFTARAEKYLKPVPAGVPPDPTPITEWPPVATAVEKDTEQTHLCVGIPGIPFDHPDRYAFAVLGTILGGNTSSRLFRKVREERGLAYSVYAYGRAFFDSGALVAYAGTNPATAVETRDLILTELHDLAKNAVSADELNRTKEYLKGTFMLSLESTSARMFRNARHEIYMGRYVSFEETLAGVDAVTSENVLRVAGQYTPPQPIVVAIGPNAHVVADI